MSGYLDTLDETGRDALPFQSLAGPREARWAFVGATWPDRSVTLSTEALAALAVLSKELVGRKEFDPLPIHAAAAAAAAVRGGGGTWPAPDQRGPRPQRALHGLDVPCMWGVRAAWFRLCSIYNAAEAPSAALCRASDAAGLLAQALAEWIGPPIVSSAQLAPSSRAMTRAWRDFEVALARYQPMLLLPVLLRDPPRPSRSGPLPELRLVEAAAAPRRPDPDGPYAA